MEVSPALHNWWNQVRKDPGAYLGDTGSLGLVRAVLGLVEMSAHDFRASRIDVILHADGGVEVIDNARNWLAGQTVEEMQPHLDAMLLKPRHKGWSYALFQALSTFFIVQVRAYPSRYKAVYSQGHLMRPLRRIGDTAGWGKGILWKPDTNIFGEGSFAGSTLSGLMRRLSYLWPGVRITLEDRRNAQHLPPQKETFLQQGGLRNYVRDLALIGVACHDPIWITAGEKGNKLNLALVYQYADSGIIRSYPSGKLFSLQGTPQRALISALRTSLSEFQRAGQPSLLDAEGDAADGLQVEKGLIAVLTLDLDNQGAALAEDQPYESQLLDEELNKRLYKQLLASLNQYWQSHPEAARRVLERLVGK